MKFSFTNNTKTYICPSKTASSQLKISLTKLQMWVKTLIEEWKYRQSTMIMSGGKERVIKKTRQGILGSDGLTKYAWE